MFKLCFFVCFYCCWVFVDFFVCGFFICGYFIVVGFCFCLFVCYLKKLKN